MGQGDVGGREKGIDVLIALAMILGAMRDAFDVAVLVSADTDLVPALETVGQLGKRCEVATWQGQSGNRSRLSTPGHNLWCHWLRENDYRLVEDTTDYTRPQPGEPPVT
ncbi:MAG: NYN domain-containing protein [Acidimicrobiales bacterium]